MAFWLWASSFAFVTCLRSSGSRVRWRNLSGSACKLYEYQQLGRTRSCVQEHVKAAASSCCDLANCVMIMQAKSCSRVCYCCSCCCCCTEYRIIQHTLLDIVERLTLLSLLGEPIALNLEGHKEHWACKLQVHKPVLFSFM